MKKNLWVLGGLGVGLAIAGGFAGSAVLARVRGPLEWVADFDHQVTGVAATADGRIFVNFPRWTDDAPISVGELMPDGTFIH